MNDLQAHYNSISRLYDVLDWSMERFRYRKLRPTIWSYAKGKTLDLGAGTGLNIPYYPPTADVEAIDLSEGMLQRARRRASRLGKSVNFRQMDATRLQFGDASFESVVATFLFCVMPNELQPQALREIRRVLIPGGRLVLMEYVQSKNPWRKAWMKVMAPWVRWIYRAGFDRRTEEFLREGNWKIGKGDFLYKDIIRMVVAQKS